QSGFTLYELMITVIIIGVVLSFGVVNLADFTRNGRMTSTANDLHAAFHLARSEAARSRAPVTICASDNAMAASPACAGSWEDGYIVFADTDGDLSAGAGEAILRRHAAVEEGVSMTFADDAAYFSFAPSGLGRGNVGGNPAVSQVILCDDRGNTIGPGGGSAARLFVVTPLGRGTILRDQTQIQTAIDNLGAACP
ncbi:MAG: GspH/FimT family pseudopilin, partial [Woeseiaceae bacterium]|nr:GspH/FimT family pseudopilin [Woeseiaceae bacterium]